jgi:carotenoid cleavage dioxygenase-like enzyme
VHAVRLKPDGTASYCNRFVDTARLRQERAAGWPMFMKVLLVLFCWLVVGGGCVL